MKELNKRHFLNYSILIPYLILSVLGLIIVFSTTVPHQIELGLPPYQLFRNQSIFFVFSLVMIAIIYKIKVDKLRSRSWFGILIPIMLALLFVARFLAPPINGAHGWIPIPGIGTIQPAEYLKLVSVWFLAAKQDKIKVQDIDALFNRKQFFVNFISGWRLWMVLMVGAVVVMPDMGNALLILISAAIVLATSGISYRWTTGFLKIFGIFSFIALVVLKITGGNIIPSIFGAITYVNKRFVAFANPFQDSSDSGHQMINGYYAMSNGGWFGRGLGNSIQKKGYLPEAQTDFVFAIVIGLRWWLSGKESTCRHRRYGFDAWVRKIPWRRKWQPTPVFLPEKSHGQRKLAGYSPWGHKESNTTEQLHFDFSLSCTGERNGN